MTGLWLLMFIAVGKGGSNLNYLVNTSDGYLNLWLHVSVYLLVNIYFVYGYNMNL